MEIVMASEEDDNTTIKGTFSELGKKYLFADTATRGKNYYKLEIPESGIYDLYIYDDIDYDITYAEDELRLDPKYHEGDILYILSDDT